MTSGDLLTAFITCWSVFVTSWTEENVETEYEMDRFIFWFHTIVFRELRNELDALNNQNNDFDDIVYRVESMERVIDSFKYLEKIDDFEDFFLPQML